MQNIINSKFRKQKIRLQRDESSGYHGHPALQKTKGCFLFIKLHKYNNNSRQGRTMCVDYDWLF